MARVCGNSLVYASFDTLHICKYSVYFGADAVMLHIVKKEALSSNAQKLAVCTKLKGLLKHDSQHLGLFSFKPTTIYKMISSRYHTFCSF